MSKTKWLDGILDRWKADDTKDMVLPATAGKAGEVSEAIRDELARGFDAGYRVERVLRFLTYPVSEEISNSGWDFKHDAESVHYAMRILRGEED